MRNFCVLSILLALARAASASPAPAGEIEEALRLAESHYLDGRTFEAAAGYRDALEKIASLADADRPAHLAECEVALYRLGELADENGSGPEDAELLARLAALPAAGGPREAGAARAVAALARYLQGFTRLEMGDGVDAARSIWHPLGFLEAWKVIGPFDNERGGQFLTELGPEKEIRLDATYDGKKRAVAWRALPARPVAGRVDFAALFEPNEQCLAYALTFVRAARETDAALRFGTDEGFRVWVNGLLVASKDVHRRAGFDQDVAGVRLREGWSSILIKSAQSTGRWEMTARLTRPDGSPLEGVEEGSPPDAAGAQRLEGKAPEIACEGNSEALLRAHIAVSPADARAHYLLGALLHEKAAHDETEHPDTDLLARAVQIDAARPVYHLFLARSHEREADIAAQKDDNAWRRALQKASELGSALADYLLADYYKRTFENLGRARAHAERALERNPALEQAVALRGEIDQELDVPRARIRAEEAIWALPRKTVAAHGSRASRLAATGKLDEAEAVLREVLRRSAYGQGDGSARSELANILLARDRVDEALLLIRADAGLDPFDTGPHRRLATCLEGRGRLDEAAASLESALEIRPEDPALHEARAKLLLRLGRKSEALAAMDRALLLQPNLPDLREYAEFLRAAKSSFEDDFRRDVSAAILAALDKKDANEGGEPARVLLDLTAIQVNRDGTTKTFSQNVIQVLNDRGIRMYDRFSTYYARGEEVLEFKKAKVTHADGTTADGKLSRHGSRDDSGGGAYAGASVDLPPFGPGDVLEIEYVREDLAQSFFGDYFGHREVFQDAVPVAEKVLILRVPADRKFYFHQRNMKVEPLETRDETAGKLTYIWSRSDIPKLDPEPAMPERIEVSPVLEVSTFESWDAFNKWYWNLIKKQLESSPELSKKVRELTSGADSELARIRAIYNFVVTEIRYNAWEFGVHGFKPYNAATIFARKFGDCKDKAALISVMLREAGIHAQPVLINADDRRGSEDLTLPMVNHFNHCIAYVPPGGGREELFLDGTAQFHGFRDVPSMDRGATVLVVGEEKASIQKVPWNTPAELSVTEEATVTILPDLGADLQIRAKAAGDYAVYVRQEFEIETQRRTKLEKVYGRRFASSSVKEETFSNLLDLDEPVSFSVSLAAPRFVLEAPEGLSLRAAEDFFGTAQSLGALGSLEKRTQDVLLGSPRSSSLRTVYLLPEGFKVKSLPPAHDLQSRFGRLSVAYEEDGPRKIVAHRVIEVTSPRVSVADYAEFRELAASVGRLTDEKIVLERS